MHRGWLSLGMEGFRYSLFWHKAGSLAAPQHRYSDITHVACGPRALWVGTRRQTILLRRSDFIASDGPEQVARWLLDRIALQPDGRTQIAHIQAVEEFSERRARRIATTSLVVLCIGVMILQLFDPFVAEVGSFAPELVAHGEWWRVFSSNVLHSVNFFPFHIVSNLILIFCFGFLVERIVGPARTIVILGVSGLAAMTASSWAGYDEVIGASGMAAGLVGAVLCLELRYPEWIPANWRLPRKLFVAVLLLQAVIDLLLPIVAGAAHLGGFVAGYVVTLYVADSAFVSRQADFGVRALAAGILALFAISLLTPLPLVLRDGDALARHARVLLQSGDQPTTRYNDLAWRMVTETHPTPLQLDLALALAERAVFETDRMNPDVLDTLAEVFFVAGYPGAAIEVIDEALDIAREDEYLREQRRRFNGERAANDRPDPPQAPWPFRNPDGSFNPGPRSHPEDLGPGLEI